MMTADHAAIRARLDAANDDVGIAYSIPADEWVLTCDKPTMQALRHAPTDLRALLDENERLRQTLDYYEKRYPCDGGCGYDGPEKECSRHGLRPTELWRELSEVVDQRVALTAKITRVEALLEWAETDPNRPFLFNGRAPHTIHVDRLRAALDGSETC